MADTKKSKHSLPLREPVLAALLEGSDIEAVLRLSVVADSDRHVVIAATVQLAESLPNYVVAHATNDAKRRVREIVGETVEIYVEPELVRDLSVVQPVTDEIVIKASD